jgi:hypothetical protein
MLQQVAFPDWNLIGDPIYQRLLGRLRQIRHKHRYAKIICGEFDHLARERFNCISHPLIATTDWTHLTFGHVTA